MTRALLVLLLIWLLVLVSGCVGLEVRPEDLRAGGALNHVYYDYQAQRCCGCSRQRASR